MRLNLIISNNYEFNSQIFESLIFNLYLFIFLLYK
jgi:hypothetical protein